MYGVIGLACDEKVDGLTKGGLIQLLRLGRQDKERYNQSKSGWENQVPRWWYEKSADP